MEPIEFPNNYETFLKLGEAALAENDLAGGMEKFEQAYALKQEPLINWLIATTAFEVGEVKKALDYVLEDSSTYQNDPHKREFLLQVLVVNKEFTQAEQQLWQFQKIDATLSTEWLETWQERIKTQAEFYGLEKQQAFEQLKIELLALATKPIVEQLTLSKAIRQLPKPDLIEVAKTLIAEPKIFILVRSFLFEELVKLAVTDKMEYLAVDGKYHSLIPAEIDSTADQAAKKALFTLLEEQLENQDPVLLATILEEVKIELAVLYPLAFKSEQVEAFSNSYLAEYAGENVPLDLEVENIRQLIKQNLLL